MSIQAHQESSSEQSSEELLGTRAEYYTPDESTILLIEKAVAQDCAGQGIDIATLQASQKPAASLSIGQTVAKHAALLKKHHQEGLVQFAREPLVLPGLLAHNVATVYGTTRANTALKDRVEIARSWDYQRPLARIALTGKDVFPEIALADALEQKWFDDGNILASESAYALLAADGLVIKEIQGANARERAERHYAAVAKHAAHVAIGGE